MFPAVLEVDNRSDDLLEGVADDLPELAVPRAPPAGVKPVRGVNIVLPTDLSVSVSDTSFLRFPPRPAVFEFVVLIFPIFYPARMDITEEDDFHFLATLH